MGEARRLSAGAGANHSWGGGAAVALAAVTAFNAKSQDMEPGAPCPTVITYYVDKSFSFEIKTPPASYFLKKAAKLKSGGATPGKETAGSVTVKQVREIAQAKMQDLNANDVDAAMQIILGSAKSMGIEVKG